MPLPLPADTTGWKTFLSVDLWTGITDHELCQSLLDVHSRANGIADKTMPPSSPGAAHSDLVLAQQIEAALYLRIELSMRACIRTKTSNEDIILEVVSNMMAALLDARSADSRGLRINFAKTVQNRTIDHLRKTGKVRAREVHTEGPLPDGNIESHEDQLRKYVDIDALRSFIRDPKDLAVFDLVRAGLKQNQVAQTLDIVDRTVRRRLKQATTDISERLKTEEGR